VPCPKYILSPDAVILRVDTALVRGQISLDQVIICFEETIYYYSLAFCNGNLDIKRVKNNENIIYSKHVVKNLFDNNKYFAKRDFPQEIFMARALVKNKVGKMHLFLQKSSRLCELRKNCNSFNLSS